MQFAVLYNNYQTQIACVVYLIQNDECGIEKYRSKRKKQKPEKYWWLFVIGYLKKQSQFAVGINWRIVLYERLL